MKVHMHDAKSNLSRLVAAIESRDAAEIEIAGAGPTVARLELPAVAALEGFEVLAISAAHAWAAGALPPHHTDPFDRMLVAQARAHRLTLISVDPAFRDYDVSLLAL